MKVALICPSNMLYMPYVNSYITILNTLNIDYIIILWDRFNIEKDEEKLIYRDKKEGHQRNFYDYLKYKKFILQRLKEIKYDKIIIFTLQLGYFLKKYLIDNYEGRYILDIRDYNKIFKVSSFKKLINYSYSTVLSSPGYKSWLPQSDKYIINHNTFIRNLDELRAIKNIRNNVEIKISTIGVIRHWNVNSDFINSMKNKEPFNLVFHGEGTINEKLKNYIKEHEINNVEIYGRYKKEDEGMLYKNTDMVNLLLYDNINTKGVLANRYYNAVIYGKPLLTLKGTYQAEQIEKYDLGLVVDSLDDIEGGIKKYLNEFDIDKYQNGRMSFFDSVITDNNYFKDLLIEFLKS